MCGIESKKPDSVQEVTRSKMFLQSRTLLAASPTIVVLMIAAGMRAQSPLVDKVKFESASIKPSAPGKATREAGGLQIRYPGGNRFVGINAGVKELIASAYRMQDWQIGGGPKWIDPDMMVTNDRFNIEAKAEGEATPDQLRLMLQSLLAERFKLRVHRETRTQTVYNLVIANGGPKFQEVSMANYRGDIVQGGGGRLITNQMTTGDLAIQLKAQVLAPVFDKTGLSGAYKFSLVWTPGPILLEGRDRPAENGEPGIDAGGPSLFSALQNQLGLKLEPSKGPVEFLIVDSVDRPSEN